MKPSSLIALALALGAVAAFFVARWVGIGSAGSGGAQVVVMTSVVEPGKALAANELQAITWPSTVVPAGAYDDPQKLVGRVARQMMFAGEPVVDSKLAAPDSKGGLASIISPGKRAITVRVNDVVAVAGFALPGSYVDVLITARDSSGQNFSKIVLNRVKVLAVAQETTVDQNKPKVVSAVTLELTPFESEKLDLARNIGTLSLVLRNELDVSEPGGSKGVRLNDLLSGKGLVPQDKDSSSISSSSSVQEIRGTTISEDAK